MRSKRTSREESLEHCVHKACVSEVYQARATRCRRSGRSKRDSFTHLSLRSKTRKKETALDFEILKGYKLEERK